MDKLIVDMDPIQAPKIYKITNIGVNLLCTCNLPQDSLTFIRDYAQEKNKDIEVIFMGPQSYTDHFVQQAKQIKFIIASQG